MDILSNLLTSPKANNLQGNDLSGNYSADNKNDFEDTILALDPSQGTDLLFSGQVLPQEGNQQPVSINFAALLKQEVGLNEMQASLEEGFKLEATARALQNLHSGTQELGVDLTQNPESKLLDDTRNLEALIENSELTSSYEVDKTKFQHNESLTQLTKKPIQLKNIPTEMVDEQSQNEIARLTQAMSSEPIKPTFFQHDSDKDSDILTTQYNELEETITDENAPVVVRSSENTTQSFKEIIMKQVEDKPTASLINDNVKQENHKQTQQSETSTAEYQIAANQTVIRKNDMISTATVGEQMIKRETFEQDLSQKLQLMMNSQENSAKFDVSPADLGKIEIKIVQDADKTHITFLASVHETQELIESSLQRLKEQVEMHGLNLGNVTVSHQDAQHQQQLPRQFNFSNNVLLSQNDSDSKIQIATTSPSSMLDIYA